MEKIKTISKKIIHENNVLIEQMVEMEKNISVEIKDKKVL